jgi:hypothetical protein
MCRQAPVRQYKPQRQRDLDLQSPPMPPLTVEATCSPAPAQLDKANCCLPKATLTNVVAVWEFGYIMFREYTKYPNQYPAPCGAGVSRHVWSVVLILAIE